MLGVIVFIFYNIYKQCAPTAIPAGAGYVLFTSSLSLFLLQNPGSFYWSPFLSPSLCLCFFPHLSFPTDQDQDDGEEDQVAIPLVLALTRILLFHLHLSPLFPFFSFLLPSLLLHSLMLFSYYGGSCAPDPVAPPYSAWRPGFWVCLQRNKKKQHQNKNNITKKK